MSEFPLHILLVVAAALLEAISKSDRLFTSETGLKLIEAFLKMRGYGSNQKIFDCFPEIR